MQEVKKIVIIGPESTGKSTLSSLLSEHYDAPWCPEYAREYLLEHGTNYTFDDLLTIAKGQVALEKSYEQKAIDQWERSGRLTPDPLLVIDTDMYVMKVWCEYVFGKCHQYILDKIVESRRDLYLLCNIDLPWVKDELREYPDLASREELYHIYKDILENQATPWVIINGMYHHRLHSAIDAVDKFVISRR